MHLIDTPTATRDGHFTEGDPLIPLPATVVSADWLNAVQDEIVSLVEAAQLPLDKRDNTQLRAAVQKLIAAAVLDVVKVDGKTLFLNKGGALTAQDVAIGGDVADLASKRGQIGTPFIQEFTKTSDDDAATLNLNDDKWFIEGEYNLYLRGQIFAFTPAVNNTPITINLNYTTRLKVCYLYVSGNVVAQELSIMRGAALVRKYTRLRSTSSDGTITYHYWKEWLSVNNIGDGILNTNGILSVPMATPTTAGLVHGDGVTLITDNGVDTVRDVAIGENTGDLASERGQIGNSPNITATSNLNDYTQQGNWFFSNSAIGTNFPATQGGWLSVYGCRTYILQMYREVYFDRVWMRRRAQSGAWSEWINLVTSRLVYEGATASAPGKSGLVPPAKAGAQELFLTGGGSYKSAITKITDSVTSAASDTAASAKAVKAAYDKAMAASLIAPGDFVFSYKASKTGFLLCNGAAVSRTTYANLFAAIGTKFGAGDGSTTFNLPDARNRVLQGASGNLGAVLAAGLPNITGALNRMRNHAECGSSTQTATGAFAQESCISGSAAGGEWQSHRNYSFNASRSNAIYGKSSTVQPPALALNCFVKY